jgi:ABC-type Fe3+ transport system permease subunit
MSNTASDLGDVLMAYAIVAFTAALFLGRRHLYKFNIYIQLTGNRDPVREQRKYGCFAAIAVVFALVLAAYVTVAYLASTE